MTTLVASAFIAAAIFLGTSVKAQMVPVNKLRFGLGVEGLLPTGNLHDFSNIGLGGTARLQYGAAKNLAFTLTSGYYNFFGKDYTVTAATPTGTTTFVGKAPSFGMVPVKAGIKAFVNSGFYFSAEVGAGFETKNDYRYITGSTSDNGKATKLILSPGIGYASKSWDVGARYENFSGQNYNYGTVGLRIAYGFGL